ncbi:hypothetical protein [Nitrospirillum viridazoti]|uniref:DUF5658 domain-containing protein n=1 Tax=Nitrospirillum amazonense TaxID=28077 RepID=A0A560IXP2_9PROT|nr:hypothetical protein [Nitrospirillum amazonense]TWB63627.1 hypothetical protein FBZ92_103118 [Nitrospirillum amazonense]
MTRRSRLASSALQYLLAYLVASGADIWTTLLALRAYGVHEGNSFLAAPDGLALARSWIATGLGAVFLTALYLFGIAHAHNVEPRWLCRPRRSFLRLYVNPWRWLDRAPLHAIAYAQAFVVLRMVAAANNWSLAENGPGPLGDLVGWCVRHLGAMTGYALAIGGVYVLLTLTVVPLAVATVRLAAEDLPRPSPRGDRARLAQG